jgi:hypothetical protein
MTFQPRRGDEVEYWVKRCRDAHHPGDARWHAFDDMLDEYRLLADTGCPLPGTLIPAEE